MLKRPALDPETLELKSQGGYPAPFDKVTEGRRKRNLSPVLGLTQFGVNLTELLPGSASALRHWHSHEDEFIMVVSGEVVLVTDRGEQVLTTGMVAGFPAGKQDGHCVQNKSDKPAMILEVGSRNMLDEGNYPDVDLHCQAGRYEGAQFIRKDGTPIG
ncbi:MAG: cupin domain-containing protein [Rhizobiales bacterium]|nr:cupin domain-containing protein [Hyphomicrobiales bacterium]